MVGRTIDGARAAANGQSVEQFVLKGRPFRSAALSQRQALGFQRKRFTDPLSSVSRLNQDCHERDSSGPVLFRSASIGSSKSLLLAVVWTEGATTIHVEVI